MPNSSESRQAAAREILRRRNARRNLLEFAQYISPAYAPGLFHRTLAGYLDRVQSGEIRRLMVFAPPQHGKTDLVSRSFPAYSLGRNPDLRVLACSYADSLATAINRDVQRIMTGDPYRALFPGSRLGERNVRTNAGAQALRNSDEFDVLDERFQVRGKYRSAGAGAGIVGKSADLIVIDDPIASAEQAYSPTYREKLWSWYNTEVATRQSANCRVVLMHQRWHEDDLAGRLLRRAQEDPRADQWTVVRFPARAYPEGHPLRCPEDTRPEGAPLWPERYDDAFLDARAASMSPSQWASLYQQNPVPLEGAHFREDWFRGWIDTGGAYRLDGSRIVPTDRCEVFAVLDPAASEKQSADHTAAVAFALTPEGDLLVLEVVRGRFALEKIPDVLLGLCRRWRCSFSLVEANGFQIALVKECRRKEGMPPVREVSPASRSKLVRATEAIARAASGQVYLPLEAPWVPDFLDECTRFTGHEGGQDEQVDCLAYAALHQSRKLDQKRTAGVPYVMPR